jgi:2'-5' RNA ligase
MDGIVSLLDPEHTALVEEIWTQLQHEFGLRGIYATRFPHFSYHLADHYDVDRLTSILQTFVRGRTPMEVKTTGLGIFSGGPLVLYIPVVRGPELHQMHADLWNAVAPVSHGLNPVYSPETWMPHITLAYGDVRPEALPDIIRLLGEREFNWHITIDQLLLLINAGDAGEQRISFPFEPPS